MRDDVNTFKEYLPLIEALSSSALTEERHWPMISQIVGEDLIPNEELTLG